MWDKVKEEIGEFEAEMREQTNVNANANVKREMTQEFGDLLFSLINVARLYKIKPDNALEMTNGKFTRRFNYIEQKAAQQGLRLQDMTIDEMETLWQEAKQQEKGVKE